MAAVDDIRRQLLDDIENDLQDRMYGRARRRANELLALADDGSEEERYAKAVKVAVPESLDMQRRWKLIIAAYLMALGIFVGYVFYVLFPGDKISAPSGATEPAAEATVEATVTVQENGEGESTATEAGEEFREVNWRFGIPSSQVSTDEYLVAVAAIAGALGGAVYGLTSFAKRWGDGGLQRTFVMWYISRPLVGGLLAAMFYLLVRAGFLSLDQSDSANVNEFGVAATGGLVGLASGHAVEKIKELARVLFQRRTED